MKKLILTAGCALLIGISTSFAQQDDSTRTREQSRRTNQTTESKRQTTDSKRRNGQETDQARRNGTMGDQSQRPQREMEIVQASEIPEGLRQTLQDPKYQGWENAIIYHNTRTDEYLVSPRPHRFNSEGKEIQYGMTDYGKKNQGKYGNRDNRSMDQSRTSQDTSNRQGRNRSNSDGSNTYSTNPTQDSTGVNATQSSSSPEQDRTEGQSSSYRQDSTRMNQRSTNRSSSDSSNSTSGNTNSSNSYTNNRIADQDIPTEGMVLVEQDQVPESLKATLRDSDYKGWERGKMYHNPATGEYILIMGGAETGSNDQRSYRFNKEGKLIKDNKMKDRD